MPSRNSINKPKDNINRSKKASKLSRRRLLNRGGRSELSSIPLSRPSGEFKKSSDHDSTLLKSTAVALYSGVVKPVTTITQRTLSGKRAKKIERNKRYIAARNVVKKQLNGEELDMEIDELNNINNKKEDLVKSCLWSVIEDAASGNFNSNLIQGEGTTLGGPFF